jgi:hypothetical protein
MSIPMWKSKIQFIIHRNNIRLDFPTLALAYIMPDADAADVEERRSLSFAWKSNLAFKDIHAFK